MHTVFLMLPCTLWGAAVMVHVHGGIRQASLVLRLLHAWCHVGLVPMCFAVSAWSPCAMLCQLGPHVLCCGGLVQMCCPVSAYSPCAVLCRLSPHVLCRVGLFPMCYAVSA